MTQTAIKSIGWIGDISWSVMPCCVRQFGRTSGVLFQTKKEDIEAGWKKPVRVEITVRKKRKS